MGPKKISAAFLLLLLTVLQALPQSSLYDDSKVSRIYITIPADSLKKLYDSVLSDHYYLARFVFDDLVQRDTLENVGFRLRGNTSRYSRKKSFKISFNEYVPGRKFQGVKKLNLNGEHNDPTMIREKLFYDLWKKAGFVERRTAFVRVYINGQYYGLYTNLEEMDKSWLGSVFPDNDGNLYKCTYPADLVYHGPDQQTYKNLQNSTATGGRVYDLQTNESQDDYTRLVELIGVLNTAPDTAFTTAIRKILNVDEALRALALDVATGNWDDYGYNKNNYYLYDCPADSLFHFITYDPDNTFGIDWFGIDWSVRDCRNWINRDMQLPLVQKLLAVPEFNHRYKRFLDTIARNVIEPDSVFPKIDAMKNLIFQAAAEDTYRTLDYGYSMGDFIDGFVTAVDSHSPIGIKPFFTARQQSIFNQLGSSGVPDNEPLSQEVRVFPDPAVSLISINLPGSSQGWTVKILNSYGKIAEEFRLPGSGPGIATIPVGHLAPGLYLVILGSPGRILHSKFIRQ